MHLEDKVPIWVEKLKEQANDEEELKVMVLEKMKLASHKWDHRE